MFVIGAGVSRIARMRARLHVDIRAIPAHGYTLVCNGCHQDIELIYIYHATKIRKKILNLKSSSIFIGF